MVIEPVEEARLIEEAKRNAVAFARLYDEYMPALYGYVYRRVSDRDAAEDITSSVFEIRPPTLTGTRTSRVGGTYSYRIALLSNGSIVALSNRQTVSVPPPQLNLGGNGQGTSVYISWSLSGVVHIDSWAVLRSGNNPSPSFPADQYATVAYNGPSGSFSDSNASPNRDYYRVVGLYLGRVIVKSNTVLLP
jgi:hypothetical protein